MRYYPTLHMYTNQSKETVPLSLFYISQSRCMSLVDISRGLLIYFLHSDLYTVVSNDTPDLFNYIFRVNAFVRLSSKIAMHNAGWFPIAR